jgi:hypothetical protein
MLLARSQYQLVAPGQSLIQVLPGDGSGKVSQSTGDPDCSHSLSHHVGLVAGPRARPRRTNTKKHKFVPTVSFALRAHPRVLALTFHDASAR